MNKDVLRLFLDVFFIGGGLVLAEYKNGFLNGFLLPILKIKRWSLIKLMIFRFFLPSLLCFGLKVNFDFAHNWTINGFCDWLNVFCWLCRLIIDCRRVSVCLLIVIFCGVEILVNCFLTFFLTYLYAIGGGCVGWCQ